MTARFFSPAWARSWALLLLAVIGLQAATPVSAPLDRQQGSAFSASTIDVALTTMRRDAGHAAIAQTAAPVPAELAQVLPRERRPRLAVATQRLRPDVRGPPPRELPSRLPDSTAPPLA